MRPARPDDEALIYGFICALADYEKLLHAVEARAEDIGAALFGAPKRAFCDIVEVGGRPVGFALWHYTFSTFSGKAGLYLEDLFVEPAFRGGGAGKALLRALAQRCVEEGLGRMDWAVLDWNAPSIAFYDALGAQALSDWTTRRLQGEALRRLAGAPAA